MPQGLCVCVWGGGHLSSSNIRSGGICTLFATSMARIWRLGARALAHLRGLAGEPKPRFGVRRSQRGTISSRGRWIQRGYGTSRAQASTKVGTGSKCGRRVSQAGDRRHRLFGVDHRPPVSIAVSDRVAVPLPRRGIGSAAGSRLQIAAPAPRLEAAGGN